MTYAIFAEKIKGFQMALLTWYKNNCHLRHFRPKNRVKNERSDTFISAGSEESKRSNIATCQTFHFGGPPAALGALKGLAQ